MSVRACKLFIKFELSCLHETTFISVQKEEVVDKTASGKQVLRIFHGPLNIGGIGGFLASYQRQQGHDAQFIVWDKNKFLLNHDQVVFAEKPKSRLRGFVARVRCALTWMPKFDVFNFYFGATLLPFSLDLPILRLLGKRIIMTYCGSDARLVFIERARNPFWSLIENDLIGTLDDVKHDRRKKLMLFWQGLWCHKIIAPRNLYAPVSKYVARGKVEKDIWVHNLSFSAGVLEEEGTQSSLDAEYNSNSIPRVLHMPSSPVVKGTKYVRDAVAILKKEGLSFEYVEVMDVEHSQAIRELRKADIVLDQFLLGGFGSLSVEAMYYAKPVVCYLIDSVKREHYDDCPVVNANLHTLKDRIEELVLDASLRKSLGVSGKAFVARHLDYVSINEKMLKLYQS